MAGNPITQADVFRTLPNHYDTVGSQSGGPNAEIEADRILLMHELGHVMASERFFTRTRTVGSGAIAQSTAWGVQAVDFANGPWRIVGLEVVLQAAGLAADIADIGIGLFNPDDTTSDFPIFTWNAATGTTRTVRTSVTTNASSQRIFLVNELAPFPQNLLLNGSQARPSANTYSGIVFRGLTAAYGAGTRTTSILVRIASMLNTGLPGLNGSYGLPLNW